MKRWLPVLTVPALLAAAPSPLVVGSVRDQYGVPIVGARVASGPKSIAKTDALGTFALAASNVDALVITCAYCEPRRVPVIAGEPVVAFVQRYDALAQQAPSDRDIACLPYARAESIASLRPFVVLENSSHALPGAQISDRGLSSRGALLLDEGIPLYDIAANQSPFVAFPAYTLRHTSFAPPSDAFTYGDLAGGGTLLADTHGHAPWGAAAALGDENALRVTQTNAQGAWLAAFSHQTDDTRARADASLRIPDGDDRFEVHAVAATDKLTSTASQDLNTALDGVRLDYQRIRENVLHASLVAAGGGYDGTAQSTAYSAKWSDVQLQGGVQTSSRIQFFTSAGLRVSSGQYWTSSVALPLTAGALTQLHVDAGAQTSGDRYMLRAGAGAFDLHYAGGSWGNGVTLDGGIVTPDLLGSYAFDPHWTLEVQAGESFALPTVLEAFVYPPESPELHFDRNLFVTQTLSYGDLRRFRASLTAAAQRVSGLDTGTVHSAGISLAWQVAPALSLRAWLLRENDQTQPYETVYRFGAHPQPATVGSYWLTYESAGTRIDAIYRTDLLDYRADPHFDASISVPLSNGLRIFGATERRAGTRSVSVGLRFETP